jgi:hypothetical protein
MMHMSARALYPHDVHREAQMADSSESQIKAAVFAIMERDQSEPPPVQTSKGADLSALARTHHERLRSEFAQAGFDLSRLEKLYNEYKTEAGKLFKKPKQPADSKSVKPTKSDQEWTENKKRVYELIAGRPLVTVPFVLNRPRLIYAVPQASLVEKHIESWNSWARWHHYDTQETGSSTKTVGVKFLFYWRNNSPNVVVIKNASADLSIRGFCQAIVQPYLFDHSSANMGLTSYQTAHVGGTSIGSGDHYFFSLYAATAGWFFGGSGDFQHGDLDIVRHVRCRDILVPSDQWAVFEVGLSGLYQLDNGSIGYYFAGSGHRIACPSLVLDLSLVVQS